MLVQLTRNEMMSLVAIWDRTNSDPRLPERTLVALGVSKGLIDQLRDQIKMTAGI